MLSTKLKIKEEASKAEIEKDIMEIVNRREKLSDSHSRKGCLKLVEELTEFDHQINENAIK
jgi:hypothetical protein